MPTRLCTVLYCTIYTLTKRLSDRPCLSVCLSVSVNFCEILMKPFANDQQEAAVVQKDVAVQCVTGSTGQRLVDQYLAKQREVLCLFLHSFFVLTALKVIENSVHS